MVTEPVSLIGKKSSVNLPHALVPRNEAVPSVDSSDSDSSGSTRVPPWIKATSLDNEWIISEEFIRANNLSDVQVQHIREVILNLKDKINDIEKLSVEVVHQSESGIVAELPAFPDEGADMEEEFHSRLIEILGDAVADEFILGARSALMTSTGDFGNRDRIFVLEYTEPDWSPELPPEIRAELAASSEGMKLFKMGYFTISKTSGDIDYSSPEFYEDRLNFDRSDHAVFWENSIPARFFHLLVELGAIDE